MKDEKFRKMAKWPDHKEYTFSVLVDGHPISAHKEKVKQQVRHEARAGKSHVTYQEQLKELVQQDVEVDDQHNYYPAFI